MLRSAYHDAFARARAEDLRVRESARLASLERYHPIFERWAHAPRLLALAAATLGERCALRFLNARTLPPGAATQDLHLDVRDAAGPRVRLHRRLIDDFDAVNGAAFVAGSHRWDEPAEQAISPTAELARAQAGSAIVFDSAIWHGHTANASASPRRSIQGGWVSAP